MRIPGKMMWLGIGGCTVGLITGVAILRISGFFTPHPVERASIPTHMTTPMTPPTQAQAPEVMPEAHLTQPYVPQQVVEEPETLPPLQLIGTMLADDPNESQALFEDVELHTRLSIRRGERIGSWELTTIERGWVLFTTPQGVEVRVELEGDTLQAVARALEGQVVSEALAKLRNQSETPPADAIEKAAQAITVVSEHERVVDRQQVAQAVGGDPFRMLSQSRMVPHLDGLVAGLRIAWLADSPWSEKVGIEVGDVVTAINGKPIFDPRKLFEIGNDFLSADTIDITLHRSGQEMTFHYQMSSPPPPSPVGGSGP